MLRRSASVAKNVSSMASIHTRLLKSHRSISSMSASSLQMHLMAPARLIKPLPTDEASTEETHYVYRGDHRPIEEVKGGFIPGNKNLSLRGHVNKDLVRDANGNELWPLRFGPSGLVSTTSSLYTAVLFANYTQGDKATVYALQRPITHAGYYYDVAHQIQNYKGLPLDSVQLFKDCIRREADLPAIGAIPFSDVVAFKRKGDSSYHPWEMNPAYQFREFSIAIRSGNDAEAKALGEGLPYIYPFYATAQQAAEALKEASAQYTPETATHSICFEALEIEVVEKILGRRRGSGFRESELPGYYADHYHWIQQQLGRPRKTQMHTLFGEKNTESKIEGVSTAMACLTPLKTQP